MSLIIATGSNIGDSKANLQAAKDALSQKYHFEAESRIYTSAAVDYLDQPDFLNQVLQFSRPTDQTPNEIMSTLLDIEKSLGRTRLIDKGPRIIDIDILFLGLDQILDPQVEIPHPRLWQRSFVVRPLRELPFFAQLDAHFTFPDKFDVEAVPLKE